MRRIDDLPSELIAAIVRHLDRWQDVVSCKWVNKRWRQILHANVTRLARPPADLTILNLPTGSRVELRRKCAVDRVAGSSSIEIEGNAAAHMLCNLFEVHNLTCKNDGCIDSGAAVRDLADSLRLGRQRRIRCVCLQKSKFDMDTTASLRLFSELFKQSECQRIHLTECRFQVPWNSSAVTAFEKAFSQGRIGALAQFEIECEKEDWHDGMMDEDNDADGAETSRSSPCSPAAADLLLLFSVKILHKFAWDLRHRLRRHPIPLIWTAPFPGTAMPELRDEFMTALCEFMENWLYNSDAPFFHISIRNCPPEFGPELCGNCAARGITQMFMQFPSRAHNNAHIKGKHNQEKQMFELFSLQNATISSPLQNAISMARFRRDFRMR